MARPSGRLAAGSWFSSVWREKTAPVDVEYIANKIRDLRVFEDAADPSRHMNRSVQDVGGSVS